MTAAAVQKSDEERPEITTAQLPALIKSSNLARATIAPFLPEGVSLDRIAASLRVALAKDRAAWQKPGPSPLESCSPMSVFMAVAKAAQIGLEVGETAHLVPFGAECTLVADYKGLAQLVIASGLVRQVETHCVYEKEPFRLKFGTSTELEHLPIADSTARGKMIGAYAIFRLRGSQSQPHIKFMTVDEIDAIRKRYSKQWKDGKLEPWYAEKTCVRQGVKLLPKDPRLAKTLAAFEQLDAAEFAALDVPAELKQLEAGAGETEPVRVHTLSDERSGAQPEAAAPAAPPASPATPAARAEEFDEGAAPTACGRCHEPHAYKDGEDLGNDSGTCFRFAAAKEG